MNSINNYFPLHQKFLKKFLKMNVGEQLDASLPNIGNYKLSFGPGASANSITFSLQLVSVHGSSQIVYKNSVGSDMTVADVGKFNCKGGVLEKTSDPTFIKCLGHFRTMPGDKFECRYSKEYVFLPAEPTPPQVPCVYFKNNEVCCWKNKREYDHYKILDTYQRFQTSVLNAHNHADYEKRLADQLAQEKAAEKRRQMQPILSSATTQQPPPPPVAAAAAAAATAATSATAATATAAHRTPPPPVAVRTPHKYTLTASGSVSGLKRRDQAKHIPQLPPGLQQVETKGEGTLFKSNDGNNEYYLCITKNGNQTYFKLS
jgi:hypothetical protein